MEKAAIDIAEQSGIGNVVPLLATSSSWSDREDLTQARLDRAPVSDEGQLRIYEIEQDIATIVGRFETEQIEASESEALNTVLETLDRERDTINDTPLSIDPSRRAELTQFVVIGADGVPILESGYWEAPRSRATHDGRSATGSTDDPKKAQAKADGMTAVLADELAVARRDVLALHIASDLSLALDLTIFMLADRAAGNLGDMGSSLYVNRRNDPLVKNTVPPNSAGAALIEIGKNLDAHWADFESITDRFDAFRKLDDEMRASWLAVCTASSIEASLGGTGIGRHSDFHDHLGQLLDINVAEWWRPTASGYFARVRKAGMQKALTSIGGEALAARYASAKTAAMAEACEALCNGSAVTDPEIRDAALSWLPAAMRFTGGPGDEPDGEVTDDDVEPQREDTLVEPGDAIPPRIEQPRAEQPSPEKPAVAQSSQSQTLEAATTA
jgi:ParB family transcriptional regulator, chromosome partitioning protein